MNKARGHETAGTFWQAPELAVGLQKIPEREGLEGKRSHRTM